MSGPVAVADATLLISLFQIGSLDFGTANVRMFCGIANYFSIFFQNCGKGICFCTALRFSKAFMILEKSSAVSELYEIALQRIYVAGKGGFAILRYAAYRPRLLS